MRFLFLLIGTSVLLPAQTLSIFSGNGQIVQQSFLSPAFLVVQAKDAAGKPAAGVNIAWTVTKGSATLPAALTTTTTDANGLASTKMLADVPPGTSFTPIVVTASSAASSVNFVAVAAQFASPNGGFAAPPAGFLQAPTGPITASAGSTVTGAVRVLVSAQSGVQAGQPVPNVGIRILPSPDPAQPSASCNAPAGIVLTDSTGVAICNLVIGPQTGTGQISVEVGESQALPPITLTVTPGVACSFSIAPTMQSFNPSGGGGIVNVSTTPACGWTAASNTPWITLTSAGAGTGNGNVTYSVAANTGAARSGTLTVAGQTLTVSQAGAAGPAPLAITTAANLPAATVGNSYNVALAAMGGTPPYVWTAGGGLPGGLAVVNGALSGVPATAGNFTFTLTVTDSAGATLSQAETLTVLANAGGLAITNTAFPNGVIGQPYMQNLTSTPGCSTPFSPIPVFRLAGGTLPPGLSIQQGAAVFAISGTPTAAGSYPFTLSVTDACGTTVTASFTLVITNTPAAPVLSASPAALQFSMQAGSATAPPSQTISVTSTTPVTYTATAASATGNWLTVTNPAGTTPGTLTVNIVNAQQLMAGVYNGTIAILAAGSTTPISVPVTLTVNALAILTVNPASLSATLPNSGNTVSQQSLLISSGGLALHFTAAASTIDGAAWLAVSPVVGDSPATLTVIINAAGLQAGAYSGTIAIASPNGQLAVPVKLTVTTAATLSASAATLTFTAAPGVSPASQTINLSSSAGSSPFTTSVSTVSGGAWLFVTPGSGATPQALTISTNPSGLAAGTYSGLISIRAGDPLIPPLNIPVNLAVVPQAPTILAVSNGASFVPGAVSPGELVTIFGNRLGPDTGVSFVNNGSGTVDTTLSDTQVFFDEIPAPVIYTSANQVSVLVPYAIAGRASTMITVSYRAVRANPVNVRVTDTSAAIFTLDASGQGAILNQDTSINSVQNGAAPGSVISIYATGAGVSDPAVSDGTITGSLLPKPLAPVTAQANNVDMEILYAGAAPGLPAGILQVNARVPQGTPSGKRAQVTLTIGAGTPPSPAVGLWVK